MNRAFMAWPAGSIVADTLALTMSEDRWFDLKLLVKILVMVCSYGKA
jgi:hypothetical protein